MTPWRARHIERAAPREGDGCTTFCNEKSAPAFVVAGYKVGPALKPAGETLDGDGGENDGYDDDGGEPDADDDGEDVTGA